MKRPNSVTTAFISILAAGVLTGNVAHAAETPGKSAVAMERGGPPGLGGQRDIVWPRWQARVGLAAAPAQDADFQRTVSADSALVLGDYYFARLSLGSSSGGLRATGGLLLASSAARTSALADTSVLRAGQGLNLTFLRSPRLSVFAESVPASLVATPYLGLGWSSSSPAGGWGLSADLGFTAGRTSASRSLDEIVRDLRLAPVMNLGVSYSF